MPADGTLAACSHARTSARPASKAVLKSSRFRGREEYGSASQLGQNPVVLWSSTRFPLRPQNPTSAATRSNDRGRERAAGVVEPRHTVHRRRGERGAAARVAVPDAASTVGRGRAEAPAVRPVNPGLLLGARLGADEGQAAMNKCLALSNKPRTRSKATKNLPTLSQTVDGGTPEGCWHRKGRNQCRFASDDRPARHGKSSRGDRRRTWEGRFADCLDRRCRCFGHSSGGYVVAAVIVPQPRVPFRLVASGHLLSYSISSGCSHLARCLSGPALEGMRESAHLMKAEEPGNFGYMQLAVIEVTHCQIVPQLLKYFSEV